MVPVIFFKNLHTLELIVKSLQRYPWKSFGAIFDTRSQARVKNSISGHQQRYPGPQPCSSMVNDLRKLNSKSMLEIFWTQEPIAGSFHMVFARLSVNGGNDKEKIRIGLIA